jgi:ribosome-interacting GTPase 1
MPANLTAGYMSAEKIFREAKTDDERIIALEEMLRTIPKHKGTDRMQGDIKRRIAKIKLSKEKKGTKKGFSFRIPREGSGQVALVGAPNVGKSMLLKSLSNTEPQVAPYPFTTVTTLPGMMMFEDIQIQLVDLPPLSPDHTEAWLPEMIRAADAALLIVDLAGFPLQDIEFIIPRLEKAHLKLARDHDPTLPFNIIQKKTLLICNKIDAPGAQDNFDVLKEFFGDDFDMLAISATEGTNLDELRKSVFDMLRIIRIYPKEPGKPSEKSTPFTIPVESTLEDFARVVHKDFLNLRYARVWGLSAKFPGQTINRDHVLMDGDIVELHL